MKEEIDPLEKDEYGLYIHAENYAECRAQMCIDQLNKND